MITMTKQKKKKPKKLPVLISVVRTIISVLTVLYNWLLFAIALLTYPLGLLQDWLKSLIAPKFKELIPDRLGKTFHKFNGFMPFALLIGTLLAEVIFFLVLSADKTYLSEMVVYLISENLSFASVLNFLSNGMELDMSTVFAVALSGHLISSCIGTLNSVSENPETGIKQEQAAPLYIRIPALLIYTVMSTILAFYLTNIFSVVGSWATAAVAVLSDYENSGFFSIALKVCALIPIGYFLIVLILITIKEYGETIFFGGAGFLCFTLFVLAYGLLILLGDLQTINQEFTFAVFAITIIATEIFRHHFAEKFETKNQDAVENMIQKLIPKKRDPQS